MTRRNFTNVAQRMYIIPGLNGTDTSTTAAVSATQGGSAVAPTGWPATPFRAALNIGQADAESVLVTLVSGSNVTFTRASQLGAAAYGSTTQTHSASTTTIDHVSDAIDFDEANAHVVATSAVHGVSGTLVGTTDTQTLSGKTLTTPTVGDFTNAQHDHSTSVKGGAISTVGLTATPASVSGIGFIIKGLASQTGDLLELQNSSAAVLAKVDSAGNLSAGNGVHTSTATGTIGLLIKGIASQSADLLQVQKSDATVLAKIDSTGALTAAAVSTVLLTGGDAVLSAQLATHVAAIARGFAGQSTDILQIQKSDTTVLAKFDSGGRYVPLIPGQEVKTTSNVTNIVSGTSTIATAASITGDGTTKVKITCGFDSIQGTVDGDRFLAEIYDSSTTTVLQSNQFRGKWTTDNLQLPCHMSVFDTPSAGAHVYQFIVTRSVGTGIGQINAGTSAPGPAFIRVEQVA